MYNEYFCADEKNLNLIQQEINYKWQVFRKIDTGDLCMGWAVVYRGMCWMF